MRRRKMQKKKKNFDMNRIEILSMVSRNTYRYLKRKENKIKEKKREEMHSKIKANAQLFI